MLGNLLEQTSGEGCCHRKDREPMPEVIETHSGKDRERTALLYLRLEKLKVLKFDLEMHCTAEGTSVGEVLRQGRIFSPLS